MSDESSANIRELARAGRPVLVRGEVPEPPPDWTVVQVRCDAPTSTGGHSATRASKSAPRPAVT